MRQAADRTRASRWPARLDLAQSASGLLLGLFMWAHMMFVASILVSRDAFWAVARFFEGAWFLDEPQPWLVSVIVAAVAALVVVHAALALRKFPADYSQYASFRRHQRSLHHEDTTLWYWQVVTGFALFFMVAVHLFTMLVHPERIGPFESGDRVWTDRFWLLYLPMLFAVEIHGGVGLYRLAVKWGWFEGRDAAASRRRLRVAKWAMTAFFIVLGLASLAAYMKIGIEHAPDYGKPYVPTWQQVPVGG